MQRGRKEPQPKGGRPKAAAGSALPTRDHPGAIPELLGEIACDSFQLT